MVEAFFSEDFLRPIGIRFEIIKCGWTNWNHEMKEKKKVKRGINGGKWSKNEFKIKNE